MQLIQASLTRPLELGALSSNANRPVSTKAWADVRPGIHQHRVKPEALGEIINEAMTTFSTRRTILTWSRKLSRSAVPARSVMDPAEVGVRWLDPAQTNPIQEGRRVDGNVKPNAKRAAASQQTSTIHGRRPRGGGQQQQFALLVLNFGGMSAFMWSDISACLDCIMSQETHKAQSVEFRKHGWTFIGSATSSKCDGVMTLINPRHSSVRVRYEEIIPIPGRALRTQGAH